MVINKRLRRIRKKRSIRNKVYGTEQKPRLTVFRSCKNLYAQIIDDDKSITLCSASSLDKELNITSVNRNNKDNAQNIGKLLAKKAKEKNISKVVFDRNGYKYHGKIKSLADACREEGLIF